MLVLMPITPDLKVLRLILRLTSNGAVQCPAAILPLPFSDPLASYFDAFSNLCQTTAFNVCIGKSQLSLKQLQGLEDCTHRLSPRLHAQTLSFSNNVYWDNKQAEYELAKAVDQEKVEIHEVRCDYCRFRRLRSATRRRS
jgi:hypothetical protein